MKRDRLGTPQVLGQAGLRRTSRIRDNAVSGTLLPTMFAAEVQARLPQKSYVGGLIIMRARQTPKKLLDAQDMRNNHEHSNNDYATRAEPRLFVSGTHHDKSNKHEDDQNGP